MDEEVHTRTEAVFLALRTSVVYEDDYSRILDMVAGGEYVWLDTYENVLAVLKEMDAGRCERVQNLHHSRSG